MDDIRKSEAAFSRAVYNQMRKDAGCPPVLAFRSSPAHWGWFVEMKGGSFSIEVSTDQAVDAWEAKCVCIQGWLEQKERPKNES